MRSSTSSAAVSIHPDFLPADLCRVHSPLSSSCHLTLASLAVACRMTGEFCLSVLGVISVGRDSISRSSGVPWLSGMLAMSLLEFVLPALALSLFAALFFISAICCFRSIRSGMISSMEGVFVLFACSASPSSVSACSVGISSSWW